MERARRLIEGLRIHHLGFGFFWTVTFVTLTGFQDGGVLAGPWHLYALSDEILLPAAVGALGLVCALRRRELPHGAASAASFKIGRASCRERV